MKLMKRLFKIKKQSNMKNNFEQQIQKACQYEPIDVYNF